MRKLIVALILLALAACARAQVNTFAALNLDQVWTGKQQIPLWNYTVTGLPATATAFSVAIVTDSSDGTCTRGGGTTIVLCSYIGGGWVPLGGGSGGGGGGGGGTAGGFGFVVPDKYPTIAAALTAAQTANSGPVVVLPTSTDKTSYSNHANIRVQNYKQTSGGADSLFFRDVSEWGPVDGKTMNCTAVSGTPTMTCSTTFVNAAAPAGDVGKLILVDGVGPVTGQVAGTMTVSSTAGVTAHGVPNSTQGVIFTDSTDGCNTIDTMPYAYVNLDATGLPAGNLQWTGNFYGKGCTHPPTQGTVNSVTGTVLFSGGTMLRGDLVTTITSVPGSNSIGLGTAPLANLSTTAVYGTDVHDAFQSACNSVSYGGSLTTGTLTFSGIGLTSRGIDCNSAALRIVGTGYQPLNASGSGSTLVYAGTTPNPPPGGNAAAYVLNLAYGWGSTVERIGIRGNSQAMPYGIMLSFGTNCPGTGCQTAPGGGNATNPMGKIDQAWIGWEWGDSYGSSDPWPPRLQSCIFSNGPQGNNDFWQFDRIYCYGADVGIDSVNDQAVNHHYGKIQTEFDNIGVALIGGTTIDDYYTEVNRVDITMGSPYWAGGYATVGRIRSYGGESSAMEFEILPSAPYNAQWALVVESGQLAGGAGYNRPDGVTSDFATNTNPGQLTYFGPPRGKVILPFTVCGATGDYGGQNFHFTYLQTTNIIWSGLGSGGGCIGWAGGGHLQIDNPLGNFNTHVDVPNNANDWFPGGIVPLMLDVNNSQSHVGSLNVQSPSWGSGPAIGYGTNIVAIGTTGSTSYKYQLTCVDSLGNETAPAIVYASLPGAGGTTFTVANGNATLNTTNYNQVQFTAQREGCPKYNLYGDNGIGGCIGYLSTTTLEQMPGGHADRINDQGQFTKDCAKHPPITSNSGSVSVGGNLAVAGTTNLNNVTITGTCTGTGCGGGGTGGISAAAQYSIPYYNSSGTASTLAGATGITVDSTQTILNAQNGLTTGASPPTNCGGTATGCLAMAETGSGTWGTPGAGVDILQADVATHSLLMSLNGAAFVPIGSGGGGGGGAFSGITSGTNTTAAMTVGSGASMSATGTGTIAATSVPASGLTSGANTVAAIVIGTGASIAPTGTGTITATNMPASGLSAGTMPAGVTHNELWPVVLFNSAAQGAGGASINCNFTAASAPTALLIAGTSTAPQFTTALFAQASIGTQYLECRYLLPSDFKPNTIASMRAVMHTDTDTNITHAIVPDVKLACDGADGNTIQPTYGSAQPFTQVTLAAATNIKLTAAIANPTVTCAANQTLFIRFEMNALTTVSTGNIGLDALKMEIVRTQVSQ